MSQRIGRALISVSDKTGIEDFAASLDRMGVQLLSTGGTYKKLAAAGVAVTEVADYTGFPEMMNGRVKTLHPKVHGGILALRDDTSHVGAMREHGIEGIDLVVVNLYPFEATVAKPDVTRAEAIEQIDIGGPSMVRSAAKNHRFVGIVTDPDDYGRVIAEMESADGGLSDGLRAELAQKAYALTARYDAAISSWLFQQDHPRLRGEESEESRASLFPDSFTLAGTKALELRYGENPHQTAAFYASAGTREPCVASAEVLNGKALSYNNLVDLDAALALAKEFEEPFVAVLKHTNPCGASSAPRIEEALERAWSGDPISAFGSVLSFTRPVNLASARFLVDGNRFVEAIIAPSFDDDAFELLAKKPKWGKSVRLLASGEFGGADRDARDIEVKKLIGGFLLQERDLAAEGVSEFRTVTTQTPSKKQLAELTFAGKIAKHVKSNAIVLTGERTVYGVGAGQMSRVDSVRLAVSKAGERARGSVLASDAFFPFPDGVETAIAAGVSAIMEPGGSVRDKEVIAACDKARIPMVFSDARHFRH